MLGGVFFWFFLAVAVGFLASNLNRNGIGWFFIACIISPVIAGIFLLIMGKDNEVEVLQTIEKTKQSQQDFLALYCTNEEVAKNNPVLSQKFAELSQLKVTSDSAITVEEIDKYTQMLLMEVARSESQANDSAQTSESVTQNTYDSLEKLKRLLDIEAITSEEYETKKAELLERL
ncbi:SHOCT domain-containing protein [Vibrio astriarenae]|uniref:SHOCT domain-containing protein n=1 Tax=Vibrio astriarenae TaxID=1481923 RepID=UPI0037366551